MSREEVWRELRRVGLEMRRAEEMDWELQGARARAQSEEEARRLHRWIMRVLVLRDRLLDEQWELLKGL